MIPAAVSGALSAAAPTLVEGVLSAGVTGPLSAGTQLAEKAVTANTLKDLARRTFATVDGQTAETNLMILGVSKGVLDKFPG